MPALPIDSRVAEEMTDNGTISQVPDRHPAQILKSTLYLVTFFSNLLYI